MQVKKFVLVNYVPRLQGEPAEGPFLRMLATCMTVPGATPARLKEELGSLGEKGLMRIEDCEDGLRIYLREDLIPGLVQAMEDEHV